MDWLAKYCGSAGVLRWNVIKDPNASTINSANVPSVSSALTIKGTMIGLIIARHADDVITHGIAAV